MLLHVFEKTVSELEFRDKFGVNMHLLFSDKYGSGGLGTHHRSFTISLSLKTDALFHSESCEVHYFHLYIHEILFNSSQFMKW